jgi:hypothetical protein
MPAAPVLGLSARFELHWFDVWPGDHEVAVDVAHGEGRHCGAFHFVTPGPLVLVRSRQRWRQGRERLIAERKQKLLPLEIHP